MRIIYQIIAYCFLNIFTCYAQTGGQTAYAFLNVESAARIAALGGNLISVKDNDINTAFYNPSLLNKDLDGTIALNYVNYFAGINYGYSSFAHYFKRLGTFSASVQFMGYGKFTATDEIGNTTGSFTANDYAIVLGYGRKMGGPFSIGANLKTIFSSLDRYTSFGLALDIAGTMALENGFTAAAVVKNAGYMLKPYISSNREPLPFEVQMGISYKLKHAPVRFSVIGENLQKWNLTYSDPNAQATVDPLTGEIIEPVTPGFSDKLMRHVVTGAEILITEHVNIRVGFNYRRRKELKLDARPGISGMSLGFGFRVKQFHISYGWSSYNRVGGSNHFSLTTNINSFRVKKQSETAYNF